MQKTLTDILKERLSAPENRHNDLVDQIVQELQNDNPVIDVNFAVDAIAALLFASFATLSSTLAVGFKFLTDNPKVIEELKVCSFYIYMNHFVVSFSWHKGKYMHAYSESTIYINSYKITK